MVETVLPSAGLQVSSVHVLPSVTGVTGFEPTQAPEALHESVWVQASLSEQVLLVSTVETVLPLAGLQVSSVHGLLSLTGVTGLAPTQAPLALHESVWVHALPSEQLLLVSTVETVAPLAGLQVSSVQGLPSLTGVTGLAPTQAPVLSQESVWVQALPSEQLLLVSTVETVAPLAGLQVSSVQGLPSLTGVTGLAPTQAPVLSQESVWVQALPSEQLLLVSTVETVAPLAGLQVSSVQGLPSLTGVTGLAPTQAPVLSQESVWVQALPSEQLLLVSTVETVAPLAGLQVSSVQGLPSLTGVTGLAPTQAPVLSQESVWVQALPSEQLLLVSTVETVAPLAGLQVSSVQGLPSLTGVTGLAPTQAPVLSQESVWVQALPSEQVLLVSTVETVLPLAGLQVSSVQGLPSLTGVTGLAPTQAPVLSQESVWVQALPSEQVLLVSTVETVAPLAGLQVSSVQGLPSLTGVTGLAPTQAPVLSQESVWVQALPSEQVLLVSTVETVAPLAGLQVSSVQGLPSLTG